MGFHWIAGIHRIRVDVADPLIWDVGWLALFGLLPMLLGVWLRRGSAGGTGGAAAAGGVTAVLILAGLMSLRPVTGAATAVVFRPDVSQAEAIAIAARHNAQIAAVDHSGQVLVLRLPADANPWSLYLDGALLVGGAGLAGCSTFRT